MEEATALAIASEWWSSLPFLERAALLAQFGLEAYPWQSLLGTATLLSLYNMPKRPTSKPVTATRGQAQHSLAQQRLQEYFNTAAPTTSLLEAPASAPTATPSHDKRLRTSLPTISGRRGRPVATAAPVAGPAPSDPPVHIPGPATVLLVSVVGPIGGFNYPRRRRRFRRS